MPTLSGLQSVLVRRPASTFLPVAFVTSWLGLGLYAHPFPLILLIAQLIIASQISFANGEAVRHLVAQVACISLGSTLAYLPSGRSAYGGGFPAAFFLTLFFATLSALCPVLFLLVSCSASKRLPLQSLRCLVVPWLWSAASAALASVSPLGRQGSWTPRGGLMDHYEWLLPTFGQPGLDFIVAAAASAFAELMLSQVRLFHKGSNRRAEMPGGYGAIADDASDVSDHVAMDDTPLLPMHPPKDAPPPRTTAAILVLVFLAALALPGNLAALAPSAVDPASDPSQLITLACALPHSSTASLRPSLPDYLHETQILASRGAKIIVWPETAVSFTSTTERSEALKAASDIAKKERTLIAMAYDAPSAVMPELAPDRAEAVNVMTLLDSHGAEAFTYAKQRLVPLVESFSRRSGGSPVPSTEVAIPLPKRRSRDKNLSFPLTLSAAICHDMSFPSLLAPARSADLLLSPASLWSGPLAWVRLQGDVTWRAKERGFGVLTCDGGKGGISAYVDPQGRLRYWQPAGAGSFVLPVALGGHNSAARAKGFYNRGGDWGALALLLVTVGVFCGVEIVWTGFEDEWEAAAGVWQRIEPKAQSGLERLLALSHRQPPASLAEEIRGDEQSLALYREG